MKVFQASIPTVLALFALAAASCSKAPDITPANDTITIAPTENIKPECESGGDSKTVTFNATADWTATVQDAAEKDWVSITPTSGGAGEQVLTITVSRNRATSTRTAIVSLNCGVVSRKIVVTQMASDGNAPEADGFPAVWDFYAMGFTNATKAQATETPAAANWKTGVNDPTLKTTFGNAAAYMKVHAKEGLMLKSDMTVTLNPGIQACGLLEGDWYEFVIPVKDFKPTTEISVYGATGNAKSAVAFWMMDYSADGSTWYEAPGALDANEGSVSTKAHFWSTATTVSTKRTTYFGPADDSFHFHRFCCDKIGAIADGELHLRLRALKYSGAFDGSTAQKGWSDIKSFHVYLAQEKPNPLMKIVAHRGGYRENGLVACSRAALKATLAQNCCGSECDIMWTKDGDLTVVHPDDNNKILGLVPSESTLAQIKAAGSIGGGEDVPSFREYLQIINDPVLNPYGAQIWVDVKWINQTLSDKAVDVALEQAKEAGALDKIILMIKNPNYASKATEIWEKYGVEVAWNGKVESPASYGTHGWAQAPYASYAESAYWPPKTYTDAGVQVSIYNCASDVSGYADMYAKALQHYPTFKAIFVNHPLDLAQHLVAGGYEK